MKYVNIETIDLQRVEFMLEHIHITHMQVHYIFTHIDYILFLICILYIPLKYTKDNHIHTHTQTRIYIILLILLHYFCLHLVAYHLHGVFCSVSLSVFNIIYSFDSMMVDAIINIYKFLAKMRMCSILWVCVVLHADESVRLTTIRLVYILVSCLCLWFMIETNSYIYGICLYFDDWGILSFWFSVYNIRAADWKWERV